MLRGKHVLLGVTASIAAYKTAILTRLLVKSGAEVKIIMTPSAVDFITPLTLSTLSKNPVNIEYFDGITGEWNSHIELSEWADIYCIAPLSANTMAKMAWGICDNLLLATYLSARCQVFFAPAMDLEMFQQPSVQNNISTLESLGHIFIPPGEGELASGLEGQGRLEEPEVILDILEKWQESELDFNGKKMLVTAGPTQEHIDPVRYITNHSSGKMGIAIAIEAMKRGAEVTLVHGPLQIKVPENIHSKSIVSANDMHQACIEIFPEIDIVVMSAAVADYSPKGTSDVKIKKTGNVMNIEFDKTVDILKKLGQEKRKGQFIVGFALETDNEVENANKKLKEKNLDMIVLNSLQDVGAGFDGDQNKITLLRKDKKSKSFSLKSKREVARDILDQIKKDLT